MKRNPQAVVKPVGDVIKEQKRAAMVDGIRYERTRAVWAQELFDEDFERDLTRPMEGGEKSVYEQVPVDSDIERDFLTALRGEASVKLFAKLPSDFRVATPLGNYEPDWAVLIHRGGEDRLSLVVETKGDPFASGRRGRENQKIDCGKAHFAALAGVHKSPARYQTARTLDGLPARR